MNNARQQASRLILLVVIITVGASFAWWARKRPAFLEFQATKMVNEGNQSAMVAKYSKLLEQKDLPKEEEIRLRKALGEIYVRTFRDSSGEMLFFVDKGAVENPYIELAKKQFDRVVALDPKDARAHTYLGWIFWYRHLESYAIEELNLSRQLDPKDPYPVRSLARISLDRGNPTQARELALQALAIAPTMTEARQTLMDAYLALGDHVSASEQYELLPSEVKADPNVMARHAVALAAENKWQEAIRLAEEAKAGAPQSGWVLMNLGTILLQSGRFEEASGCFSQAALMLPDSVWPRVHQTEAFFRRGNCEATFQSADILIAELPTWCWSHMMDAWIQLCKADTARALKSVDEALRAAPDLFEAIALKAEILTDQSRFGELGDLVRPLLDQKKHQSEAYALLARSFLLQKNRSMAQEMADAAIKLDRQNAWAFTWLAMSRAALKDRQGMTFAFDTAKSLRPFDKTIQAAEAFYKGTVFSEAGAEEDLKKLVSQERRNPVLWQLAGDYARHEKKWGEAINAYQTAIALKSYLLVAHLGLIDAMWQSGMKEQSDVALSAALEINSKNPEVLAWRTKIRNH